MIISSVLFDINEKPFCRPRSWVVRLRNKMFPPVFMFLFGVWE